MIKGKNIIEYDRIYHSNNYGDFIALKVVGISNSERDVLIKFLDTGTEKVVKVGHIITGTVKDPYKPIIYGVACIGFASSKENKMLYGRWKGILKRCYDTKANEYSRYGGIGIRVSNEWLCFENFVRDAVLLPGYDDMINNPLIRYDIDKDLLQQGIPDCQKIYSKETCCWIPWYQNNYLARLSNHTDNYFGACKQYNGNYRCTIYINGELRIIGTFTNELAAANAYNYYAKHFRQYDSHLNDCEYMPPEEWVKYHVGLVNMCNIVERSN